MNDTKTEKGEIEIERDRQTYKQTDRQSTRTRK